MTISASTHPTLVDVANVNEPDGQIAQVAELLNQQNEMLPDMVMVETNEPLSHRFSVRTGFPSGAWRSFNEGVQPSKSKTATVTANVGNYEMYAEVDRDLANLNGNSAAWRLQEERPFLEHMNQEMQAAVIRGNEVSTPGTFSGLQSWYATRTVSNTASSADNIIHAGGSGTDHASIWFVCWSPMTVFATYPKGSQAGLQVNDKGEVTIEDADGSGGRMEAYRTHYKWNMGLCVKDWRYAVRIANIDKSDLLADVTGSSYAGANLPDLMFQAMEIVPNTGMGRCAFYMSRDVRTKVRQQLSHRTAESTLTMENVGGVPTQMFAGFPMRRVDALAMNEGTIS